MNLRFTQDRITDVRKQNGIGAVLPLSKAADVAETDFGKVVQIIDESGNEVNCTIDKFIEIFDRQGLEGFIL